MRGSQTICAFAVLMHRKSLFVQNQIEQKQTKTKEEEGRRRRKKEKKMQIKQQVFEMLATASYACF